jgi:Protein of unknown function (DUF3040)
MSLSHRHRNQLHLIETHFHRSDPQLATKLSVFGRLSAGQAMPAWEQVATRRDRIRQAAALIAETVSIIAGATVVLLRAVLALAVAAVGMQRRPRRPVPGPGLPRRLPPGLG